MAACLHASLTMDTTTKSSVILALAIALFLLIAIPLSGTFGMFGMTGVGMGHMMAGGSFIGMSGFGIVWALLCVLFIAALVVLLTSTTSRTP